MTDQLIEAARAALGALEGADEIDTDMREAIFSLRIALAAEEAQPAPAGWVRLPDIDKLAQQIRWLNGSNKMGAGALAERIVEWIAASPAAPASQPVALTIDNSPLGTRAPAIGGGYWVRVERGWKWCTGSTFPRPGGDWTGELIAASPAAPAQAPLRNSPLSALSIRLLVAAGHVTQEKADEAFRIACSCMEAEAAKMNVKLPWVVGAPAQVPLTDEQIDALPWVPAHDNPITLTEGLQMFARAVEAAHGITKETT